MEPESYMLTWLKVLVRINQGEWCIQKNSHIPVFMLNAIMILSIESVLRKPPALDGSRISERRYKIPSDSSPAVKQQCAEGHSDQCICNSTSRETGIEEILRWCSDIMVPRWYNDNDPPIYDPIAGRWSIWTYSIETDKNKLAKFLRNADERSRCESWWHRSSVAVCSGLSG